MFRIDNYERKGVDWPYNFVYTVFEKAGRNTPKAANLPMDIERTVTFVIGGISEKRSDILLKYFRDHKSVGAIAEELGVTKQSISFDLRTTIERIANSNSVFLLECGVVGLLNRRIRESYEAGYADGYFQGVIDGANGETEALEIATIEDMDLSVRAFNCLARANYRTASEVSSCSAYDICKIRNLGLKCAEEIYNKLKTLGFDPSWDMDSYRETMAQIHADKYWHKKRIIERE